MADYDPEQIRARLEQRAAELAQTRSDMRREGEGAREGELADVDQHPADSGTETHDEEVDRTTEVFMDEERRRIDEALHAVEQGTYGTCIECGQAIPPARLEAVPEAVRCIEHQRSFEGEHRQAYPPSSR